MKNRSVSKTRRPIWKKLVGIGIVTAFSLVIVAGIHYTVAWAGSGYDYNGNEVRRALPVAASGTKLGDSTATVVVKDNSKSEETNNNSENEEQPSNSTGGKVVNTNTGYVPETPALNVTNNTNATYPQTGESTNIWLSIAGMMLIIGTSAVLLPNMRKRIKVSQ